MGQQLHLWAIEKVDHKQVLSASRMELERKYAPLLCERLDLGNYVSYTGNKQVPVLRLYRYKEAFAYPFVQEMLRNLSLSEKDFILDPFCGLGTTVFTAGLHRIPSWGVDKLPVAVFVASTLPLLLKMEPGQLREAFEQLQASVESQSPAPVADDVAIMKVAFPPENLLLLRRWKASIERLGSPLREVMMLLLLSILEACSYTSKDGQFLRLRREKPVAHPTEALRRKVQEAERDILFARQLGWHRCWQQPVITLGDARQLPLLPMKGLPNVIITSPPYVNRYDYTRSYSLELCFAFVRNFEELKALRFSVLRSHIEAKVSPDEIPSHPTVVEVLLTLKQRCDRLNNPRIPAMIAGYFVDMERVIQEWARVLAPEARVVMVVDNVRFEGEMLPVDLILCDMAEQAGFGTEAIWVARYKGNSAQQMGRYGRVPVRESVLFWRKR